MRAELELVAQAKTGLVHGFRMGAARVWRAIPYAAPPVGAGRFMAPAAPLSWEDALDGRVFGAVPVQVRQPAAAGGSGRLAMGEDCLTLNVAVPDVDSPGGHGAQHTDGARTGGLPVIVWIYGGAFTVGAGANYPGERLAVAAQAVVVTLNYRLGALGFLDFSQFSTPERPFESNLGLRDQIAALEWVRDNIASFGGDPGNVTVMGESAGAISVICLMSSPRARGLFHRAIAQSPAPRAVAPRETGAQWAREFIGFLGADIGRGEAAAALENATTEQLLAASDALALYHQQATPGVLVHGPVVDGDVLPRSPMEVFEAGQSAPVPLLIGTNDNEGRLFQMFRVLTREEMLPTSRRLLDRMFALTDPGATRRILAAYPGYPGARARAQVIGDKIFWAPTIEIADAHSRQHPTYMYRFDQSTPRTRLLGATHATELGFVFGQLGDLTNPLGTSRAARLTSARMMRLWGRFADEGAPERRWPAYDEQGRATMIIDGTWRVEHDPRGYRHRAWAGFRSRFSETPNASTRV